MLLLKECNSETPEEPKCIQNKKDNTPLTLTGSVVFQLCRIKRGTDTLGGVRGGD